MQRFFFIMSHSKSLAVSYSMCLPSAWHAFKESSRFLFSSQLFLETFRSPRRIQRDINLRKSSCKVPAILVLF